MHNGLGGREMARALRVQLSASGSQGSGSRRFIAIVL